MAAVIDREEERDRAGLRAIAFFAAYLALAALWPAIKALWVG